MHMYDGLRRCLRCLRHTVQRGLQPLPVQRAHPARDASVPTALPMVLVMARASDMNRSMPSSSTIPATGILPSEASVAASVMNPDPVTPADPFDVSSSTPSTANWSVSVNGVLVACATKIAAMV